MTLYTRHGDNSLTTTFDGERVEKTSPTIAAYGDIDELISHIGLLRALISEAMKGCTKAQAASAETKATDAEAQTITAKAQAITAEAQAITAKAQTITDESSYLEHLQRHLLAVGWCLMSSHPSEISFAELTREMEARINTIDKSLPRLHTFVIPGNTVAEAQCHVCRTVSRRAERSVVAVAEEMNINPQVLAFMNRLSDYLFVLARKLNFITHQDEKRWNKTCR